jgi:septal ring factor EnvC (AmiA/AmiB activator)
MDPAIVPAAAQTASPKNHDRFAALKNLDAATKASDARVDQAQEDTFVAAKAALEESERKNELLAKQLQQLASQVGSLKLEFQQTDQANKNAIIELKQENKALKGQLASVATLVNSLKKQLNTTDQCLHTFIDTYNVHGHLYTVTTCGGYSRQVGTTQTGSPASHKVPVVEDPNKSIGEQQ